MRAPFPNRLQPQASALKEVSARASRGPAESPPQTSGSAPDEEAAAIDFTSRRAARAVAAGRGSAGNHTLPAHRRIVNLKDFAQARNRVSESLFERLLVSEIASAPNDAQTPGYPGAFLALAQQDMLQ